jgi:hypothetical protein
LGLCFLNLLNSLHHWFLQPFFFPLINNTLLFSWFSILEHLLFSYFIFCGNINIHHIYICNDCLCISNKLNYLITIDFPWNIFCISINKLWTICHFMSIQTTYVACIWRCLLWFMTWLCYLYGYHYGLFFLLLACLHIVVNHPRICAMFVSFPCITLCFCWCYLFGTMWYWQCTPCFYNSHAFFTQHCCLLMLL